MPFCFYVSKKYCHIYAYTCPPPPMSILQLKLRKNVLNVRKWTSRRGHGGKEWWVRKVQWWTFIKMHLWDRFYSVLSKIVNESKDKRKVVCQSMPCPTLFFPSEKSLSIKWQAYFCLSHIHIWVLHAHTHQHTHPLLTNPPTPTYWPWHSSTLGHIEPSQHQRPFLPLIIL